MPRREKPAKSNQNDGPDDDPAVAGAEIPRKPAPCAAELHRLDPADATICFASRPRSPLGFFRQRSESNLGCIYRDAPWNSRPATAGTNSRERQQFSEFPALVLENEIPRKSAPAYSVKEKRDHPPRGCCRLGRRCEGDRPLLGPEPNESNAGQQFSEFRFQQARSTGR
jgi:hypothetical protein